MATNFESNKDLLLALMKKWENPQNDSKVFLGSKIWESFLSTELQLLIPKENLATFVENLLLPSVSTFVCNNIPISVIQNDIDTLRESDITLEDILGQEVVEKIRKDIKKNWKPNRNAIEKILDQPIFRQAFSKMIQKSFQQFLNQTPFASNNQSETPAPKTGLLGNLGRSITSSITNKAEKAAQFGKNLVEGVGSTIYKQIDEQIQPYISSSMSQVSKMFTDSLFESEQSQELFYNARLYAFEKIIKTPLKTILPPPKEKHIKARLETHAIWWSHIMNTYPEFNISIKNFIDSFCSPFENDTLESFLKKIGLNIEPSNDLLLFLGSSGFRVITSEPIQEFLISEIESL